MIFDNRNRSESFDLSEFLAVDELERFQIVSRFDRYKSAAQKNQHINSFLLSLILYCRKQMLGEQGGPAEKIKPWLSNISIINSTKQMLDAKVPAKSALDYLLINVNLHQKMV